MNEASTTSRSPATGGGGARRSGFTLLEAILSLSLIITMLAGVFGFYATTLRARESGSTIAREATLAHSVLQKLAQEIRAATDFVPGDGIAFNGTHDKITILRATMPDLHVFDEHDSMRDDLPPAQMDMRRITYELIWDSELKDDEGVSICHGLLRTEQKTFDPNPRFVVKQDDQNPQEATVQPNAPPIETELVAPEIKYLRFEYFDGASWNDRWQNVIEQNQQAPAENADGTPPPDRNGETGGTLPQAVRITIGRIRVPPEDEEFNITQLRQMDERQKKQLYHPDRFSIVVYLEEADQSHLSSRQFGNKNREDLQMGGEQ